MWWEPKGSGNVKIVLLYWLLSIFCVLSMLALLFDLNVLLRLNGFDKLNRDVEMDWMKLSPVSLESLDGETEKSGMVVMLLSIVVDVFTILCHSFR